LARADDTRPQDRADLRALLDAAGVEDIALAAGSVDLIRRRGFDRGRNLAADLAALIGTRGG
jgi:hypothetical protein